MNYNDLVVGFYEEYPGGGETDPAYGANRRGFIYTLGGSQRTGILLPGCAETELYGINKAGTVVGNCPGSINTFKYYGQAYNPSTGADTNLLVPGAAFTKAFGINDLGQVVGIYVTDTYHCFLYSGGTYSLIPDPPGSTLTWCSGINNAGQVVGYFVDAQSQQHGFIASGPVLLDPVPTNTDTVGLMNGPAVGNTDWLQTSPGTGHASYGLNGRPVNGIAADGVSEIVIRVPAKNVGDQFTFTLLNDANASSTSTQNDGALGNPGDTTFTQNQVTVSAINLTVVDGSQSAYAFAVYRAPIDFVRQQSEGSYLTGTQHYYSLSSGFSPPCGGPWPPCTETVNFGSLQPAARTDDQLASRGVTIQVQDLTNGNTSSMPVEILRPPVVLIHGLWDNAQTWNSFNPLVNGPYSVDPRFYIGRVDYSYNVGSEIAASDPDYSSYKKVAANSLGFAYNAPLIAADIAGWVDSFKQANNPLGIPVAAVQADIVAHSMGGDIARTIAAQTPFAGNNTLGQGDIHKLITIDTPHLGSALAPKLVSSQESCTRSVLAFFGNFAFNSVVMSSLEVVPGAVGDLSPGSQALTTIATQDSHPLPTALIAAIYTNFGSAKPSIKATAIFLACGYSDPLAQALGLDPGDDWPAIFGEPSDAIVEQSSQLDGLSPNVGLVFSEANGTAPIGGLLHSPGANQFGFSGPSVLSPLGAGNPVPAAVINLLNTPVTNTASFQSINP